MSPKKVDATPPVPGAIWFRERPPARARGSLDRAAIARAATPLLDEGGVGALSLRALAERLGVHATSLYWHVSTRDDLLDLAVDAVFAELDPTASSAREWTLEVAAFMGELRAALLRHPWSGPLVASRPLLGPEALRRSERVYASLHRAGFSGVALTAAAAAVSGLVVGSVTAQVAWSGQDEAAARRAMHEHLRAHADRYPTLGALTATTADWTDQFDRATDALLRGLAAQRADEG